ncbi:TrbG/VirB9 family P-type conjugative transfer protein [Desulfospira joergensenii]|uniref:TrbG/VirB9 family P-type conjugative transfer protein n=1 Tax=Desulfospira joergensenii TaxID=53329 RepID=UPI00129466BF|nr:TrbG/VirB9 family P-type conjugative transfer protein [Desulfospira joergensenii]
MKISKIIILIIFALGILQGSGFCGIVDEASTGKAVDAGDIPNRPMRDDANLKAVQAAFDKSDPRANVKRFPYDPDVTYKIRLREFMGSTVVLPRGERIAGYSLFDKHNFTFAPLSDKNQVLTNVFDVYAKYHGADTNLIVHGESGNIYSFYLRNDSVKSTYMPSLVTYIEDPATEMEMRDRELRSQEAEKKALEEKEMAEEEAKKGGDFGKNEYLDSLPTKISPEKLSFAYIYKGGEEKIKPLQVFDDGYFTFFQFGHGNMNRVKNLPTVYRVVDGYDTPVNSRIQGGYIVAEAVNDKWTLRSGEAHYCIWKQVE